MSRRKKSPRAGRDNANLQGDQATQKRSAETDGQTLSSANSLTVDSMPRPWMRRALTALVLFHLCAVALSMSAVVAPSETQSQLNVLLHPYTMPTHFRTQGERIFLASDTVAENAHRLEVVRADDGRPGPPSARVTFDQSSEWEVVPPGGFAGGAVHDRYARWMATIVTLVDSESASLVAQMLLPTIRNDSAIQAVRLLRLPAAGNLDADTQAEEIYVAAVSRSGEAVSLVQINERRLRTINMNEASDKTDGGDDE